MAKILYKTQSIMWNNKKTQKFPDGEFTNYYFANGNYVGILLKKYCNGYTCDIIWKFGIYQKNVFLDNDPLKDYDTKNKIILKELYNLYNSLKKHKYKTTEKKLLLSALIIVIHDVKEETYKQLNLF